MLMGVLLGLLIDEARYKALDLLKDVDFVLEVANLIDQDLVCLEAVVLEELSFDGLVRSVARQVK